MFSRRYSRRYLALGVLTLSFVVLTNIANTRDQAKSSQNATEVNNMTRVSREIHLAEDQLPAVPTPRRVVIVTYQRAGSTLFGGLFDRRPGHFYVFEPVDSLYSAMYGVREGWNVPADIMNYSNGTLRVTPERERRAVVKFLSSILSCDLQQLPLEFLLRGFWKQFSVDQTQISPFVSCLTENQLMAYHRSCQSHIYRVCPRRFGMQYLKEAQCYDALWNSTSNSPVNEINIWKHKLLNRFSKCTKHNRDKSRLCTSKLTDICRESDLHSVKTIRVTMDTVSDLLGVVEDLHILHLIRDPRAVALSRRNYWSSGKSLHAGNDLVKEARMLCANLVRDLKIRAQLEKKYPGRILQVFYEDFVGDPMSTTRNVFEFVGENWTEDIQEWVMSKTRGTKDSVAIASKWRSSIKPRELTEINRACKEYFDFVSDE